MTAERFKSCYIVLCSHNYLLTINNSLAGILRKCKLPDKNLLTHASGKSRFFFRRRWRALITPSPTRAGIYARVCTRRVRASTLSCPEVASVTANKRAVVCRLINSWTWFTLTNLQLLSKTVEITPGQFVPCRF